MLGGQAERSGSRVLWRLPGSLEAQPAGFLYFAVVLSVAFPH